MASVTVYTTGPACMRCTMTKRALSKHGLTFVEVDIRDNPQVREYLTAELGYSEAPVCVVEDGTGQDHWAGFRPEQIERVARSLAINQR